MIAFLDLLLAATLTALGGFLPARLPYATLGMPILPDAHEVLHWKAVSMGWCTLSLQVPAVWVAGVLLGPRLGLTSQLLLLLAGLAGLPVFTSGGGIHYVSEPTFGYLLGFLPAVAIIGALARRTRDPADRVGWTWLRDSARLAGGLLLGQGAMWTVGLVWQVIALHGITDPAVWSASVRGTLQLGPSYLLLMAALVVIKALTDALARLRTRRPAHGGA